jgi:outer membrane protein TolC
MLNAGSSLSRIVLNGVYTCVVFSLLLAPSPASRAQTVAPAASAAPVTITLNEAIRRAQLNEPTFAAALADKRVAALDKSIAVAGLLPSASYHNQALYTQPNGQQNQAGQVGSQAAPVFIANNAVHEYTSQAVVNETIGLSQVASVQAASANAARASAELEISRRGLVATVVSLYYSVASAERKAALLDEALKEVTAFTDLTRKREAGREAAHADVVKAQLQQFQRQRDLADARVQAEKARLELAVLLFPDPRTAFVTQPPAAVPPLPARAEVDKAASAHNPEIASALATLRQNNALVLSARAAYLPDLGLNFTYGIDAPQFSRTGPDNTRNLGYALSATVDLPVWDWFSTQHRVKQSEIRRDAAAVALSAAQRRLIANLDEAYSEADAAHSELDLLVQSVSAAAESLRLTRLRYQSGEATVFEMVDAQSSLISAQTAQADGDVRYQAALANLQILTGTL